MRMAIIAALLLAGAARADDRSAGQWTKDQASKVDHAAGSMTKGDHDANMRESESGQAQQRREELSKNDFDIKGKVSRVSKDSITLHRDDSTTATLHVDRNTKVELDGNVAHLNALRPGQDVKASFNLKGDKPMAIEIKASK